MTYCRALALSSWGKLLSWNKTRKEWRNTYIVALALVEGCSKHGDDDVLQSLGLELLGEALIMEQNYKIVEEYLHCRPRPCRRMQQT